MMPLRDYHSKELAKILAILNSFVSMVNNNPRWLSVSPEISIWIKLAFSSANNRSIPRVLSFCSRCLSAWRALWDIRPEISFPPLSGLAVFPASDDVSRIWIDAFPRCFAGGSTVLDPVHDNTREWGFGERRTKKIIFLNAVLEGILFSVRTDMCVALQLY